MYMKSDGGESAMPFIYTLFNRIQDAGELSDICTRISVEK